MSSLHESTFEYLQPTAEQTAHMSAVREAFHQLVLTIDGHIPEGPDKTYLLRKLRECGMWANVAITRTADGRPRI